MIEELKELGRREEWLAGRPRTAGIGLVERHDH
jgi:hypothetical protein